MSVNEKCVKVKDITDEEATGLLMQITTMLNRKFDLEEQKSSTVKRYGTAIKAIEGNIEEMRQRLNDGIVVTVHNYMNKGTHEIDWKDEHGNIIESTPFDEDDWNLYASQSQRSLFPDDQNEEPAGDGVGKLLEKMEEEENKAPGIDPETKATIEGYTEAEAMEEQNAGPFDEYSTDPQANTPDGDPLEEHEQEEQ